jgi:hypothetical protein
MALISSYSDLSFFLSFFFDFAMGLSTNSRPANGNSLVLLCQNDLKRLPTCSKPVTHLLKLIIISVLVFSVFGTRGSHFDWSGLRRLKFCCVVAESG